MPKGKSNGSVDMNQYVDMLGSWFKKAPSLPKNATDVLVKIAPWFALVFGVLGILGGIAATGFLAALSPFIALGGGMGVATGGIVGGLLVIVGSVLMVMAFPGLNAKKESGWNLSFYSEVVSIVSSLVALNIVGAVISALIGFYLLFQIRSYYK